MAKLTFCGAEVNESNAATLTRARAVCNELWHRLCALDCTHCSTPMQLGNRGGAPRIRAAWYSVGIKATCKGHAKPRADCERRTARPPGVDGTTMRHAEAVPRVGTSVVTRGVCILDYLCTCTSLLHCEARTRARTLVLYHVARSLCFLRGFAWVQQRTTVCVAEVLAVVVIPSRQVEAGLESSWFHLVVAACVIERVVLQPY